MRSNACTSRRQNSQISRKVGTAPSYSPEAGVSGYLKAE